MGYYTQDPIHTVPEHSTALLLHCNLFYTYSCVSHPCRKLYTPPLHCFPYQAVACVFLILSLNVDLRMLHGNCVTGHMW